MLEITIAPFAATIQLACSLLKLFSLQLVQFADCPLFFNVVQVVSKESLYLKNAKTVCVKR